MKILFIRMSYIGDILHATPAAKALKEKYPQAKLYWICTPSLVEILKHNPYVDEIIEWERDVYEAHSKKLHLKTMWTMWWELRKRLKPYQFDMCVDVQGRLITGLVMLAAGAKIRLGMSGTKELNWLFTNRKSKGHYTHVIERYNQVVGLVGANTDDLHMVLCLTGEEKNQAAQRLSALAENRPTIGLVFGTSWPSKQWTEAGWRQLIERLAPNYNLVFIGGPQEIPLKERITQGLDLDKAHIYDGIGQTSLRESAALINQCQALVVADTGALHMAEALDVPSVALFGPTRPELWGPLGPRSYVLQAEGLSCLGCRKRRCKKADHPCMSRIKPEEVEAALQEILAFAR